MFPKYLSVKIEQDKSFDGKQQYKAVVAIDKETFAFRGDSFSDCYQHTVRSIEEYVKMQTAGGAA